MHRNRSEDPKTLHILDHLQQKGHITTKPPKLVLKTVFHGLNGGIKPILLNLVQRQFKDGDAALHPQKLQRQSLFGSVRLR